MFTSEGVKIRLVSGFDDYLKRLHRRAREIHRDAGRVQIAAELLAEEIGDVGRIIDDEDQRAQLRLSGLTGPPAPARGNWITNGYPLH
jgi:hypothetical protein